MSAWTIVERGGQRDALGEGLLWSARDNAVYWTDILAPALNRLALDSGKVERFAMPEMIGWVIERQQGGFIAGFKSGFATLDLSPLRIGHIANPYPQFAQNRLNDAKADSAGRIWAGSMPITADRPDGGLYRLDPDGSVHDIDSGYFVANGPAFSPDERWLYHTDTVKSLVYRFALQDRVARNREVFIRFEEGWGRPDGMTVDAQDHLWIAHWGGACVSRFTPNGQRVDSIALPAGQITNVCFAGEKLDRMFVTSAAHGRPEENQAGDLFEITGLGVTGLAPHFYKG